MNRTIIQILGIVAFGLGTLTFAQNTPPMSAQNQSAQAQEQVMQITATTKGFTPSQITLKKGIPAILELKSMDTVHDFNCPELKVRKDFRAGQVTRVHFVPQKTGIFEFHCDYHPNMKGKVIVTK